MFIPVSCFLIVFIYHESPLEIVDPGDPFYKLFFRVAVMSEGSVKFPCLYNLTKFKSENPKFSFIVPKTQSNSESFILYRVISDSGTEQIIEVEEDPDSLYALRIWSRYRATNSVFTPISLRKISITTVSFAFLCSLVVFLIGRMFRKKMAGRNAQQDDQYMRQSDR